MTETDDHPDERAPLSTTVTTSYVLVKRDQATGRVLASGVAGATAAEAGQRAALTNAGGWLASWRPMSWQKDANDQFWTDPATVIVSAEDPDSSVLYEARIVKRTVTVVDEPMITSGETAYELLPA
ncbi:hypothetical protein [Streptomyces adelaidensis]|uniref:hypothetical protein n=1 Tax=Streptomyces adelaidensis TaxID=2796465 RepID=UPI0019081D6E|nr:hypothetical protein [Streptomyces adelaidensis]